MPSLSTALSRICSSSKASLVEDGCYSSKTICVTSFRYIIAFPASLNGSSKKKERKQENLKNIHHDAALNVSKEIDFFSSLNSLGNFEPPKFFCKVDFLFFSFFVIIIHLYI